MRCLVLVLCAVMLLPAAAGAAGRRRVPPPAAVATDKKAASDKAEAPKEREKPAGSVAEPAAVAPRGPTRIDFDDRLIQGQTNKSGAVYLFDRKELSIRSMVQQRTSFRDQIIKDILVE
jgi:hypothetical protein